MNKLDRKITPLFLFKFTISSIIMMLFNSVYTIVDGSFISKFVGTDALSATNIVYPVINLIWAVAIMLASGGNAIISKQMGEGRGQEARENFSLIGFFGIALGVVISIFTIVFEKNIVIWLGADSRIYDFCYEYLFYMSLFFPLAITQVLFQFLFVSAGRPGFGLFSTIAGGIANMVLDYVFVAVMKMGVTGAAIATGMSFTIPSIVGFIYFIFNRKGSLYFVMPVMRIKVLLKACSNGMSEMISNLALAVITVLFNIIMMRELGPDGVAAVTIVFYAQFLFSAIFLGYSMGISPLFAFNYGAENAKRLKMLFSLSSWFVIISSLIEFAVSVIFAGNVVSFFTPENTSVFEITSHGMKLFAISYLPMGVNIFASGMFTAFSNGRVSAIISFLRTFVFIVAAVIILPYFIGIDGIWLAVPAAEILSLAIAVYFIIKYKKTYEY